ncbi:hypothetical protein TNCV_1470491 [Trichonephila clavipes]|nr:hypothetical protein TNCV_1470491 [Trichonephila clavipes]
MSTKAVMSVKSLNLATAAARGELGIPWDFLHSVLKAYHEQHESCKKLWDQLQREVSVSTAGHVSAGKGVNIDTSDEDSALLDEENDAHVEKYIRCSGSGIY